MMRPILVVEDNEDDVLFLKRTMGQIGLLNPIDVVRDGESAIEYLRNVATNSDLEIFPMPSLVLLDLKLPIVPGLEVLRWIRQQDELKTLIVVILSSSNLDSDIALAYRLGANSFLVKTSSSDQLRKMMRMVKEYWLELNAGSAS